MEFYIIKTWLIERIEEELEKTLDPIWKNDPFDRNIFDFQPVFARFWLVCQLLILNTLILEGR